MSAPQAGPFQPTEQSASPSTSHLACLARQASDLRTRPNHLGFPDPIIRLSEVKRPAPSAPSTPHFTEKTETIQAVPAGANLFKNPPQEYINSNSLRSEYGKSGISTRVITNYVAAKEIPTKLFEYSILFGSTTNPDNEPKSGLNKDLKRLAELRRVFDSLRKVQPLERRNDWATDLKHIWSVNELFRGDTYSIADLSYINPIGRTEIIPQITLKYEGQLNLSRGHLDLIEGGKDEGGTDVARKAKALNAIVSNYMCRSTSTPIHQLGANRFFLTDAYEDMGQDSPFVTIRGYFSSIRPGNNQVFLNVNTTTSAFFKPILISEFFRIMRLHGMKDWAIMGMLKKRAVRLTCDRLVPDLNEEDKRRKTINGFGAVPSEQTFTAGEEEIIVYDYFNATKDCPLAKDSNMPCVNVGSYKPGREQWIPAEFLEITYPQPYNAMLPPAFTDRMMKVALRGPAENANLIVNEGFVHLGIKKDSIATQRDLIQEEIGFDINDKLIDIPARILKQPTLRYSDIKGKAQTVSPRFASWNLVDKQTRKQPFAVSSPIPRIGILTLGQSRMDPRELARRLSQILPEHNIRVTSPEQPWHRAFTPRPNPEGSFVTAMNNIVSEVESEMRKNVITVVLLSTQDENLYSALKTVCDTWGILTICSASPPQKMNDQMLSNIAVKFSLKTGGRPHQVEGVLRVVGTDTVIMGADATRPGSTSAPHCPSVAAAVASYDEHALNYSSSMRLQRRNQEIITDIQEITTELLNIYGRKNKRLPSNIVFYRDGVSEGQYAQVRKTEVEAVEKAWMVLKNSGKPSNSPRVRITCMVVGKRHHTRFYPMKPGDRDRSNNVMPGLVVDSVITHPYCFDFFLQSHAAIKGTARSAHYFLIRNDIKLNAQQLQDLTHSLCYAYGTATKGISYCAPAYHADKLCERGRCFIRDWLVNRPTLSSMIRPYNKKDSIDIKAHQKDEAKRLMVSRPYNIWETAQAGAHKGRKNPWHPNLDDKMFWV